MFMWMGKGSNKVLYFSKELWPKVKPLSILLCVFDRKGLLFI